MKIIREQYGLFEPMTDKDFTLINYPDARLMRRGFGLNCVWQVFTPHSLLGSGLSAGQAWKCAAAGILPPRLDIL